MSLEDIRDERIKKLKEISEPYPADVKKSIDIDSLLEGFDAYEGREEHVWVAGRVMAFRRHGGVAFTDVYDGTGTIQVFLRADKSGEDFFESFSTLIDVGDFIEAYGTPMTTKTGQKSILAQEWRMLAKSLRPLPEKWHGLKDSEERLRRRYLDILFNQDIREMIEKKALFWREIRSYLEERGFIGVETPTLELSTGGAEATPFKTYHEDYDLDVYLRISVGELWQKRLMVAGLPRTYEIGKVYRNEGSSPEHLQEFTNVEFYCAYMNFEEGKNMVRDLYRHIALKVFGKTAFETRGYSFDLSHEWKNLDYVDTVKEKTGVDVLAASDEELASKLKELGVEYEGENRERMTDALWKHCRKEVSGPAFLTGHPKLVAPLSKADPLHDERTKTFQVILAGSELGRAHAELNDPLDQRERFLAQKKLIEEGDREAMMPDWDYVEAMEYGMPPVFGFGFGERLFSYLINKPIRETQIFPLMKPR